MIFALAVCDEIMFTLEPLRALDAVVLAQSWQVFRVLRSFPFLQVFLRFQVGSNLVVVPNVSLETSTRSGFWCVLNRIPGPPLRLDSSHRTHFSR